MPQLAGKYSQPFDELHPADQRNATYSCGYHNQDDDDVRLLHAAYHAVMEEFDQEVGQLLEALEQQGILDDTLIIYASDHGESARAHGNLGKCSMYEESIGIPLIVAGPGVRKGKTESAVVSHLDIFATVADATELMHPSDLRGRSLLPLLRGQAELPDDPILIQCHAGNTNNGVFAIRQGHWKLVEFLNEPPALFNLAQDPDEMDDLVRHQPDSSQTRSAVESLRAALGAICDPLVVDATAKNDQRGLKEALITAGQLEEEVYQRGYRRSLDQLIPWEWEQFERLYR